MSLEDELRKLDWNVTIDEETGSLRIISTQLRCRVVIVPRGGDNSITIARIKPSALLPDEKPVLPRRMRFDAAQKKTLLEPCAPKGNP